MRRVVAFVASALVLVGCGSSSTSTPTDRTDLRAATTSAATPTTTPSATATSTPVRKVFAPGTFDRTDALLDARVGAAGLADGMIRIVAADGTTIHEHVIGGMSGTTLISIASSTKWLTAATLMTFVDRGVIRLDDDISKWLPEFAGSNPPITTRQLLDHTSGVHDNPCQDDGTELTSCVNTLAVVTP